MSGARREIMVGRFGWSGGGGEKRESCQILSFWPGGKTKGGRRRP